MAVFFGVLIAVCCVKDAVGFGSEGHSKLEAVNKIVDVLAAVSNWEGVANELNVQRGTFDAIKTTCTDAGDLDKCYKRELVKWYCDSTGYEFGVVAESIAQALVRMGRRRQAANMRALEFNDVSNSWSRGQPTKHAAVEEDACSSDDPDCNAPNTLSYTTTPPVERWREEEPTVDEFHLIRYKDADGIIKHYGVLQNLQKTYKDIGICLGIFPLWFDIYEVEHPGRVEEQSLEVFSHWKNAGSQKYPFTWNGVLEVLWDAELGQVAHKLEKVLSNKVELPQSA